MTWSLGAGWTAMVTVCPYAWSAVVFWGRIEVQKSWRLERVKLLTTTECGGRWGVGDIRG